MLFDWDFYIREGRVLELTLMEGLTRQSIEHAIGFTLATGKEAAFEASYTVDKKELIYSPIIEGNGSRVDLAGWRQNLKEEYGGNHAILCLHTHPPKEGNSKPSPRDLASSQKDYEQYTMLKASLPTPPVYGIIGCEKNGNATIQLHQFRTMLAIPLEDMLDEAISHELQRMMFLKTFRQATLSFPAEWNYTALQKAAARFK